MNESEFQPGTRVYYTGDMANRSGFGVVRTVVVDVRWGVNLVIRMDDGQVKHVTPSSFDPGPGRRFMTEQEYKAERAARIAEMKAEEAEREARRVDRETEDFWPSR